MPEYPNPHGRPVHPDADSDRYIDAEPYAILYPNVATLRDPNTIIDRHVDRPANGYADRYKHNDSDIHADSYYYLNTNASSIGYADAGRD